MVIGRSKKAIRRCSKNEGSVILTVIQQQIIERNLTDIFSRTTIRTKRCLRNANL